VRLRVVGYETIGSHGYVAALRRQAEALGIGNRVEFLAPISREELMKATQMSDIGLALLPASSADQNFQSMPGASNKAFDYLACGLPVIVSDLHDWHEMFVAPGYGLACNPGDPTSIAAAIGWLIDHPDQMRQMGESGRRKILSEWNYESVFQPVMQYLSNPDSVGKSAVKDSRFQDAR
jgi:glycosyltransferase involved in cell wall biosynthesis